MDFPQKIYSSKVKNLVLLLVCAVFVIGGIWIGGFWGWFNVVFFGLVRHCFWPTAFAKHYLSTTYRPRVYGSLNVPRTYLRHGRM